MFSKVLYAEEDSVIYEEKNSLYLLGFVSHVVNDSRNKEGYMELIGYSRELFYGKFIFDIGINTYVDSYYVRSYTLFSNISHTDFQHKWVTPMFVVGVTNKGEDYDTDERQTYAFIIPKIRFGARDGIFADISGLPEIGDITNGWVALEVGYRW